MTQRYRRKAVEVEAEYVDINPIAPWWVEGDPAYPHGMHITTEQFERDYEPVPSEPHDFDPMAGCCNPRLFMEVNGDLLRWREALQLADKLAEAVKRIVMNLEHMDGPAARAALSEYLESRGKGKGE